MLQLHRHVGESFVIINSETGEEIWIAVGDIQGPRGNRAPKTGICIEAPKKYTVARKELHEAKQGHPNPSPQHWRS